LLDAEILSDVFLAMTGGQVDLGLSLESAVVSVDDEDGQPHARHPALFVLRASDEELVQHELRLEDIEKQSGYCMYRETKTI
jgi:DNA polymerase-3 subunit epsilon